MVLKNQAMEIKLTALSNGDQVDCANQYATIAKRIPGLLDDKCQHWKEHKGGHIEKNGRPKSKYIRCQHHIFDRILYVVKDDELAAWLK